MNRPTPEDDLREGLDLLSAEAAHRFDAARVRTAAVSAARRRRARREAAAGAAAAAALAALAVTVSGLWPGADPVSPAGVPSTASGTTTGPSTGDPLTSGTGAPTSGTSAPSTVVGESPILVRLSVRSGPGGEGLFPARWEVHWRGGDAPAYLIVLLDAEGEPRGQVRVPGECTAPERSGRVSGEVAFAEPGPHRLTAVVRARRCGGAIQRSSATVEWSWDPGGEAVAEGGGDLSP